MNDTYLNDTEKSAIAAFNSNKVMAEAVKKVLLATVYHQGTVVAGEKPTEFNFAFAITNSVEPKSDAQIGQELRASIAALNFIKNGFDRLAEFKVEEKKTVKGNPAV